MARRRDNFSAPPPRGHQHHHSSRRQHRHDPPVKEKESGFDWTPGIVLALLGALTLFSHDFDKYRRKHDGNGRERRRGVGSDDGSWDDDRSDDSERGRGRRRYRSRSRFEDDAWGSEDDYYSYGGARRFSR
ncbi:hypothetical protein ACJ41O_008235 [Fusarium nematophilum]